MGFIHVPNLAVALHERIIRELCREGSHICDVASHTHRTKRRTGNQENAYGYGVYCDGILEYCMPAVRVDMAEGRTKDGLSGEEELRKFFDTYVPDVGGYVLVVVNAMWYSALHEEGGTPTGSVYKVVTQTYGMMKSAAGRIAQNLKLKRSQIKTWYWTRRPEDRMER